MSSIRLSRAYGVKKLAMLRSCRRNVYHPRLSLYRSPQLSAANSQLPPLQIELRTEVDFAGFGIVREKFGRTFDEHLAFHNDVAAANPLINVSGSVSITLTFKKTW